MHYISDKNVLNWAKVQLENNGTKYENGDCHVTLYECAAFKITFSSNVDICCYQVWIDNFAEAVSISMKRESAFYEALRIAYTLTHAASIIRFIPVKGGDSYVKYAQDDKAQNAV